MVQDWMVDFQPGCASEFMLPCDKFEHGMPQVSESLRLFVGPYLPDFVPLCMIPSPCVFDLGVVSHLQHACKSTNFLEMVPHVGSLVTTSLGRMAASFCDFALVKLGFRLWNYT